MLSNDAATRLSRIRQELACVEEPRYKPELLMQLPSMHLDTRAAVCIPVAASNNIEVETLPYTLEQLRRQVGTMNFEILLFLNRPEGEEQDDTLEIARHAQTSMRNLHIIEAEIAPEKLTIGYVRGLLHGVVSERARRAAIRDLIHVVVDADMVWLHPRLVQEHCNRLISTGADACIGQLDWDHPDLPTREIPGLIVGSALMRLLPKYANKHLIELAGSGASIDPSLLDEVVFARNFGRGVLANVSIRDEAYRRVGGYQPLAHGEDYDIMQRIWESGRRLGRYNTLSFGWKEQGIGVTSNSRRALWALYTEGLPAVRQWDYEGYKGPGAHASLPDMAVYRTVEPDLMLINQLINKSLAAFPLPAVLLRDAITATLKEMGLLKRDYKMRLIATEANIYIAEIVIRNVHGLMTWLCEQMETGSKRVIQKNDVLSEVS